MQRVDKTPKRSFSYADRWSNYSKVLMRKYSATHTGWGYSLLVNIT